MVLQVGYHTIRPFSLRRTESNRLGRRWYAATALRSRRLFLGREYNGESSYRVMGNDRYRILPLTSVPFYFGVGRSFDVRAGLRRLAYCYIP